MEQDISKLDRPSPPISSRTRSVSREPHQLNSTERSDAPDNPNMSYRDKTNEERDSDTSIDTVDGDKNPELSRTRTSEDDYMLPDQMNSAISAIQDEIDWFELDFCKQPAWEDKLASQSEFIDAKIKNLLEKASILATGIACPTITKLKQLSSQLSSVNNKLQEKARAESGASTRVVLRRSLIQAPKSNNKNGNADCTLQDTVIDVFDDDKTSELQLLKRQVQSLAESIKGMTAINDDIKILKESAAKEKARNNRELSEVKKEIESIQETMEEFMRTHEANPNLNETLENIDVLIGGIQSNVRENKKKIQRLDDSISVRGNNITILGNTSTSQSSMSDNTMAVLEDSMEDLHGNISIIISRDLDGGVSQTQLCNLVKKKQPTLSKMVAILYDKLMRYTTAPNAKPSFSEKIKNILSSASKWSKKLNQMYIDLDMDDVADAPPIPTKLGQFSAAGNQHVYEFLLEFERVYKCRGDDVTKSNHLWENHLSQALQVSTEMFKHNLGKMTEFLTDTFGTIEIVVNTVLRQVESTQIPGDTEPHDKHAYLRKFLNAIQKILEIPEKTSIPRERWENHVLSLTFIQRLRDLLSFEDKLKYAAALTAAGLHPKRAHGKYAIDELVKFIEETADNISSVIDLSQPIQKPRESRIRKAVHNATVEVPSEASNEDSYQVDVSSKSSSSFKKPCALRGHAHEVGTCEDFLSIPPYKRRLLTEARMCWTCLGPRMQCKVSNQSNHLMCRNLPSINKILICSMCEEYIRNNNKPYSPCNILMCTIKSHVFSFPTSEQLLPALTAFLPAFDKSKLRLPQVKPTNTPSASNTAGSVLSAKRSNAQRTVNIELSKDLGSSGVPVSVDTHTGKIKEIDNEDIIYEVKESSVFIMQMLKIGEKDTLVLFDNGSSMHLMEGGLAESQNLERLTDKPSTLTVIGGGTVNTHYGVYRFFMGPTMNNQYHEVVAQGIPQVTGYFHRLDLSTTTNELKSVDTSFEDQVMPTYIGGCHAQLVLGIKDPAIHPSELFILPSGLGVYKSNFKDIFGSRICFGGPHHSFTNNSGEFAPSTANFVSLVRNYYNSVFDATRFLNFLPDERSADFNSLHDFGKINAHHISCAGDHEDGQVEEKQHQGAYKAAIPMARYRELLDQEKDGDLVNYRCEQCADCQRCKQSGKSRAITVREKREQAIIEKSVTLDYKKKEVRVVLPFLVDPVKALTEKFRGSTNYSEALRVYMSQTRKPVEQREAVKKVIKELIDLDFMCSISELSAEIQELISSAPVTHYYPWRIVLKLDSTSTPVRIVVDPSMTGLNMLLAKGENVIGKLTDIIIRNRFGRFAASTDIRKMYNMLRLEPSEYQYSLFLYHPSMEAGVKPQTFVMKSAWYGVSSTGNQADYAVVKLAEDADENFEKAKQVLTQFRYVDDSIPSANTAEYREDMLRETEELLSKIGFKLKYVIRSGEPPPEGATPDGQTVKMLGYGWIPESDVLFPAYGEINFNPKKRGAKKANPIPVATPEDVRKLLQSVNLTKRDCLARSSEFFDPAGIWEPWKLQLKLKLSEMNHIGWDETLSQTLKDEWTEMFSKLTNLSALQVQRTVVPVDADLPSMRLICLSDAAEKAIGAAIYVGFKLKDGTFSCQLLTAKSKMASHTIPRNELCGILLMSELAYIVKNASPFQPNEIVFATDSTIAMSWCSNPDIKLKQFVLNRVESISRLIEWTTNSKDTRIHHIAGELNLADKLTRKKDDILDDISMYSQWQQGLPWMKLPTAQLPLTNYEKLTLSPSDISDVQKECQDLPYITSDGNQATRDPQHYAHAVHLAHAVLESPLPPPAAPGGEAAHADLVKKEHGVNFITLGWNRGIRVLTYVIKFVSKLKHKLHTSSDKSCMYCNEDQKLPTESQLLTDKAERLVFTIESNMIRKTWPKSRLEGFVQRDGILYFSGRLDERNKLTIKDIDFQIDLINTEFNTLIPVVRPDSQLYFAYVWNIHHHIKQHAGIELTVRELLKKMYIPGHFRHVIKRIKQDCSRCNIIAKNTVNLEMAKHHFSKTLIAPVFYTMQMDIMYGFKAKPNSESRKTFKLYALILVCLHTSATNILAIDAISTQAVVNALERHACRYGMPAQVYVDNGSQLKALDKVQFSIKDMDAQMYDSRGIRVCVSTAKNHEERGKVENKVRTIRDLLKKSDIQEKFPLTPLHWETIFAQVSNAVDDIPIAKGNSSNVTDLGFELLSPNRLKMGRNNYRSLHTSCKFADPTIPSQLLEKSRKIMSAFFQTLVDSLHHFQVKPGKWGSTSKRTPKVDDIVLFKYNESNSSLDWKLGRVVEVDSRNVRIMYSLKSDVKAIPTMKFLKRSFRDVVIIFSEHEIYQNSEEYFGSVINES